MINKLFNRWIPLATGAPRPQYLAAILQPFCGVPQLRSVGVAQINQWVFQNIAYRPDVVDQWAPAQQTLSQRYGDCEDQEILKRALLIDRGYTDDQLNMIIVNDIIARQQHALLLVQDRFILDSRTYHVLLQENVHDYVPIKAYSQTNTWIFGQ
jgi:predicted transglutaminase-like cysteine proteinase